MFLKDKFTSIYILLYPFIFLLPWFFKGLLFLNKNNFIIMIFKLEKFFWAPGVTGIGFSLIHTIIKQRQNKETKTDRIYVIIVFKLLDFRQYRDPWGPGNKEVSPIIALTYYFGRVFRPIYQEKENDPGPRKIALVMPTELRIWRGKGS